MILEPYGLDWADLLSLQFKLKTMIECAAGVAENVNVRKGVPKPLNFHGVDTSDRVPDVIIRHRHPEFSGFLYRTLYKDNKDPNRCVSWLLDGEWNLSPFILCEPIAENGKNIPRIINSQRLTISWLSRLAILLDDYVNDHDLSFKPCKLIKPGLVTHSISHFLACRLIEEYGAIYTEATLEYTFASPYGPSRMEVFACLESGGRHRLEILPELLSAWFDTSPEAITMVNSWIAGEMIGLRAATQSESFDCQELDLVEGMRLTRKLLPRGGSVFKEL